MGRMIDADRLKEVFRRNVVGGNAYFDLIDMQPTVDAIPKADYETRLKADMVAMLDKVEEDIIDYLDTFRSHNKTHEEMIDDISEIIKKHTEQNDE